MLMWLKTLEALLERRAREAREAREPEHE